MLYLNQSPELDFLYFGYSFIWESDGGESFGKSLVPLTCNMKGEEDSFIKEVYYGKNN